MARWLVMWARGVSASHPYLVTRTCFTPYIASKAADAAPAGPLPTTRTSVSIVWVIAVSKMIGLCVALLRRPGHSAADISGCGTAPVPGFIWNS